jgi:hypothetical protein
MQSRSLPGGIDKWLVGRWGLGCICIKPFWLGCVGAPCENRHGRPQQIFAPFVLRVGVSPREPVVVQRCFAITKPQPI